MQQSSSSIGALATALAKAQIELVNPEKSMIATIRSDEMAGVEQIFRYAPLSSGLEILRKTLGQHEIAILQATAIDEAASVVKLTTSLCHSSGEWVGSTWPVCSLEDVASPKRMGAALSYARRYALFTLAGIAGEDDLDAADLTAPEPAAELRNIKQPSNGQSRQRNLAQKRLADRAGKLNSTTVDPALKQRLSAVLRDQLRNQLNDIDSAEAAAIWARRILPAKNSLCAADARQLEDAFEERLAGLNNARPSPFGSKRKHVTSLDREGPESTATSTIEKVETSGLIHPEPRRVRDREHVKFVAGHPCLICGRRPADPHHLRFAQSRALGRKVSDEFTVPLCRGHHREVHRCGDEAAWWAKVGVEPLGLANALWRETHPLT
jgi:hypothetical protein